MSKQTIWNYFKQHTQLSDEAIAGIMGNFEAESNNESCRVQGDFTADRRVSKQYASDVNSGIKPVAVFRTDAKGWGLAQWTYYTRKQGLYDTAQSYGTGIEDEITQIRFFLAEMQTEYVSTWKKLLSAPSIYEATRLVCHEYERPDYENVAARAEYSQIIYKQFHGKEIDPEPEPDPSGDDSHNFEFLEEWIEYLEELKSSIDAKTNELRRRLN